MPSFQYRALTQSGEIVLGTLDASDEREAAEKIRALGHYPIEATSGRDFRWWSSASFATSADRPRLRDLTRVTQELATLAGAGLPLDRALEILSSLDDTKSLHESIRSVHGRVRGGMTLADALSAEKAFPKYYVRLVHAGETGGSLAPTLSQLGAWLERMEVTRQAVSSALVYPAVLLGTMVLSVFLILVFVLPAFEPLFQSAGTDLPLATRIVITIGEFVGTFWWAVALLIGAGWFACRKMMEKPETKLTIDRFTLRLPLIGKILLWADLERMSRTLGTLLKNGVTLPAALTVTRDTLSNSAIASAVETAQARLREGGSLSEQFSRTGLFPSLTLDLIKIGETTGQLDEMLLRQADIYERTLRQTIDRLLALLVPALTLLLGAVVAGLIASILVAILSVNNLAL